MQKPFNNNNNSNNNNDNNDNQMNRMHNIETIHFNRWLTCDLRDPGIQIIALPSREQVTMLSCVNLVSTMHTMMLKYRKHALIKKHLMLNQLIMSYFDKADISKDWIVSLTLNHLGALEKSNQSKYWRFSHWHHEE